MKMVVKKLSGVGRLIRREGGEPITGVHYDLVVTQDLSKLVRKRLTSGERRITGNVSKPDDLSFATLNSRKYFTLVLNDGRKLDIFIANRQGTIVNLGADLYFS